MQLKLKIESNINLQFHLNPLDWRMVEQQANKISICSLLGSQLAIIKDKRIKSDYIYDINYEPTGIDIKRELSDKERIAQLEKEVAELKGEKSKQQEYYIWNFSKVTDFFTREGFHYGKPLAKEYPFYTIKSTKNDYFVVENTVTNRLYNVPMGNLKPKEEYMEWKRNRTQLKYMR